MLDTLWEINQATIIIKEVKQSRDYPILIADDLAVQEAVMLVIQQILEGYIQRDS